MASTHEEVLARIESLYHLLFDHNGYGEMSINIRFLRKREKEVLIRCGKQYRYIVPCDCSSGRSFTCGQEVRTKRTSVQTARAGDVSSRAEAGGEVGKTNMGCGIGSRATETGET